MRCCLGLIMMLVSMVPNAYAARDGFPRGCEAVGHEFKDADLILKPQVAEDAAESGQSQRQTLYMLHNSTHNTIVVRNYVNKEAIVAPVWEAIINGQRWAAFATNKPMTKFRCQKQSGGNEKQAVDCQSVIEVCQYPRAKFSISNFGTYWVTSNQSLRGAMRDAIQKGILLRW